MSLRPDQRALLFLGAVLLLGAAVRLMRAGAPPVPAVQPALDHQLGAADSARGDRHAVKRKPVATPDSSAYVLGKLDLDVATEAQIESLPGIGPALARRIPDDRAAHGPFGGADALRRVRGVTPSLLHRVDSAVTFSGRVQPPVLPGAPPRATLPAARRRSGRRRER
jgi:DNA uptake protein ComE-like DNA-binding protein